MKQLQVKLIIAIFCILLSPVIVNAQDAKTFSTEEEVIKETLRSWESYKELAWGHDVLKPLSKSYSDWYEKPLYISPIDAYSTLHLMELTDEAAQIESYVVDSLDFNQDVFAKTFEVNIRILGGLLAMYDLSTFTHHENEFDLNDYIFTTEAHQFDKSSFKQGEMSERLGF